MNTARRRFSALFQAAALLLSGCAAGTLHQPSVQVLFTTRDTIKLMWHIVRFDEADAQAMANAFCKGRTAVVTDAGPPMEYRHKTWTCT